MGAGASSTSNVRKNKAEAEKLFGRVKSSRAGTGSSYSGLTPDANQLLSVVDILQEVQRHGAEIKAYWTIETIEEVFATYDTDHDGKLSFEQFLNALNEMEADVERHGPGSPRKKAKGFGRAVEGGKGKAKGRPGTAAASKPRAQLVPRSPLRWPPQRPWTWRSQGQSEPVEPDELPKLTLPTQVGSSGSTACASDGGAATAGAPATDAKLTALPSAGASALAELEAMEVPVTRRREMYETQLTAQSAEVPRGVWSVSMRNKNPWDADGETGMTSAMAFARTLGLTPLLIDNTATSKVDEFWTKQGELTAAAATAAAVAAADTVYGSTSTEVAATAPLVPPSKPTEVLEAWAFLQDEKLGTRTKALIIKEARRQLVSAMRHGRILYVRLKSKAVDFTHYSDDDSLPMASIFDQRVATELAKYTTGTAECAEEARNNTIDNHGLFEADHPWAKCIKEGDLDNEGNFFVAPGFGVVVGTTMDREMYVENLRIAFSLHRFQPIQPQ